MFPSHQQEIGTIAVHLLGCLDEYERGMDQLVRGTWDTDLYESTAARFDQMKQFTAAMPRLSAPWVELLIRRFELTALLWERIVDAGHAQGLSGRIAELHGSHASAVEELRSCTCRFVPRND